MDWLLRLVLAHVTCGNLQVTTARGAIFSFGDGAGPPIAVRFVSTRAQWSVLLDPDLRLGEAYMDGTFVVDRGSVAEFVEANAKAKAAYFNGDELGVSFVRTAVGPNAHPGLEIVRYQETADGTGPILVRQHAPFVPMDADAPVLFVDPVVLIHAPFRVMFAYAGTDDVWLPNWRNAALLPTRIQITVRDGVTQQKLAVSTAALVHVDTPAECVKAQNANQCMTQIAQAVAGANKTPAATEPR